jgi:hypothetical protein
MDWRTQLGAVTELARQMREVDSTIANAARSALRNYLEHEGDNFVRTSIIDALMEDEALRAADEKRRADAVWQAQQEKRQAGGKRQAEAARQTEEEQRRAEAARRSEEEKRRTDAAQLVVNLASADLASMDWRTRLGAVTELARQMREVDTIIANAARSALQTYLKHEGDNFVRASIIDALMEDEALRGGR